jgi:hypothetical protein
VTADELDAIERLAGNVGQDFQFGSFFLTEATAFLVALLTTTPSKPWIGTLFLILVVVGFMLSFIFAIRWYKGRSEFVIVLQKIRDRPIGPVGSEGHELKAAELANLTSVEPIGEPK